MQGTAEKIDLEIDERTVLESVLRVPKATLAEIATTAKLLPPFTYELVSELRMRDLLDVIEDDNGTRRYLVSDPGRELLGIIPEPEPTAEEAQAAKDEEAATRGHRSALKVIEALAEFPHALKEPEQRELVLIAVREKYGTIDGIKKRVGFPAWFDTTELLAGMCVDYKIRKETKGDLAAYFLYEDKPLRFWRIGDGRIDFEKDPNFVPRDESAKAAEMSNPWVNYPDKKKDAIDVDDDFDPDDEDVSTPIGKPAGAFETKAGAQNGASNEVKKNATPARAKRTGGRYAYREISTEQMETAAAKSSKFADICGALNLSQSALYKKLDEDPDLKAAYKRGIAMRSRPADAAPGKKNGRPMKESDRPAKQQERPAESPELDLDEVERLAKAGYTIKAAAKELGVNLFVFKNRLTAKKGPLKAIGDAWRRGKAAVDIPNGSRPAAKAVKAPVKRVYKKRDKPADTEPVIEAVTIEEPAVIGGQKSGNQDVVIRQALNADLAGSSSFYEIAENFSFNVGNALVHIQMDELDAAIFYLERERSRRERQAIS